VFRERTSIVNKKDGIHPVLLLVHSVLCGQLVPCGYVPV
jgi:hypothetical protein